MTKRLHNRRGSDDARSWVRSIHFGNQYAKAIMMAIANYCNEDGTAYPGIETLHRDTEIASNTIVARLKWVESIGAITLAKCWIDEHGNRNKQGRGRLTSTEIRFLFDADIEAIEVAAREHGGEKPARGWARKSADDPQISPASHAELNPEQEKISPAPHEGQTESVSPSIAPQQPCTPCGRILNQEDSPPTPPSGGARSEKPDEEESKIQIWFDRFASAYPIPISDVPRTKGWARKATGAKREDAITGAAGYAAFLAGEAKRGRSRAVKDAHRWLNAEGFAGYLPRHKAAAAQGQSDKPSPELHSLDTPAGRALKTLSRIAHYATWEHAGQIYGVVTPKVLAFATAPPGSQWTVHKRGTQQFWAWWEFLSKEVFAGCALRELTEIIAPWEWPPRKDGTIYTPESTGPPGKSMAEQDAEWIEKHGLG